MKGCRKVGEIDDKEIFICKKEITKEKLSKLEKEILRYLLGRDIVPEVTVYGRFYPRYSSEKIKEALDNLVEKGYISRGRVERPKEFIVLDKSGIPKDIRESKEVIKVISVNEVKAREVLKEEE